MPSFTEVLFLLLCVAVLVLLLFLWYSPIRIARRDNHPALLAIRILTWLTPLFWPLWLVAAVLAFKAPRFRRDIAYGCFLYCGLILIAMCILNAIPLDEYSYMAAMGFGMAALPSLFLVGLVGIPFAICEWREWPLSVLLLLTVVVVLVTIIAVQDTIEAYSFLAWYGGVTGLLGVALPVRWFFWQRKRAIPVRTDLCPACGYPIGTSSVCTDCGAELPSSRQMK